MIRPENERITITLSRKQIRWIEKTAKDLGMTKSKLIKWLLDKNISKILNAMYEAEEIDKIRKIAKTPWIKFDDED